MCIKSNLHAHTCTHARTHAPGIYKYFRNADTYVNHLRTTALDNLVNVLNFVNVVVRFCARGACSPKNNDPFHAAIHRLMTIAVTCTNVRHFPRPLLRRHSSMEIYGSAQCSECFLLEFCCLLGFKCTEYIDSCAGLWCF